VSVEGRFDWAPFGPGSSEPAAAPSPVPARRLAIVTCMDARIDPLSALGLRLGDAHVIRNAGALVTDDVVRSLELSISAAGTTAAVIVTHSDCVALGRDDEVARTTAREELERLRAAIPALEVTAGFYDFASGRVNPL
jgi:carbonic anhydrase